MWARAETSRTKRTARGGAAMIVCIFIVSITSLMVVSALNVQTSRMAASRNTAAYEQALYLAGAAAHHALAELEADASWRTGLTNVEFPAGSGNTYSATVTDSAPNVMIDASGTAGSFTRRLQLTVSLGG